MFFEIIAYAPSQEYAPTADSQVTPTLSRAGWKILAYQLLPHRTARLDQERVPMLAKHGRLG